MPFQRKEICRNSELRALSISRCATGGRSRGDGGRRPAAALVTDGVSDFIERGDGRWSGTEADWTGACCGAKPDGSKMARRSVTTCGLPPLPPRCKMSVTGVFGCPRSRTATSSTYANQLNRQKAHFCCVVTRVLEHTGRPFTSKPSTSIKASPTPTLAPSAAGPAGSTSCTTKLSSKLFSTIPTSAGPALWGSGVLCRSSRCTGTRGGRGDAGADSEEVPVT